MTQWDEEALDWIKALILQSLAELILPWEEFKGGVRLEFFLFFQPGPELILAGVETLEFNDHKGQKEGE